MLSLSLPAPPSLAMEQAQPALHRHSRPDKITPMLIVFFSLEHGISLRNISSPLFSK